VDQFITFRSRRDFLAALRLAASERGIPVSKLIRDTLVREIKFSAPICRPYGAPNQSATHAMGVI